MNILLLVVDSLRAGALRVRTDGRPRTPFLDQLDAASLNFRRAYATECWTLPTHASIFTGLLPSQHGAHFQTMGYAASAPTIAELLGTAGYHTEIATRNFVFDGTIPGITRGFQHNTRLLSQSSRVNAFALLLALAKPRFRRHIRETGFFHPFQKDNRRFLADFARSLIPADDRVLGYALERMHALRTAGRPYFLFCNLYDVHAPYPPSMRSILRSFRTLGGWIENPMFPKVMAALGAHTYLRPGFTLSVHGQRMLRDRYHRAIELMDAKLAAFYHTARAARLFDDTLVILTSDHGEAFGEHDLYLHDASVWNTHLHVPLWVNDPRRAPEVIDDVVSTRDLFGLMQAAPRETTSTDTLLDAGWRARRPIALAEHFYYPDLSDADPRYRHNQAAAIGGTSKIILRDGRVDRYDLTRDAAELAPQEASLEEFARECRRMGIGETALDAASGHLRWWQGMQGARQPDAA
jgi:hypothetical protein